MIQKKKKKTYQLRKRKKKQKKIIKVNQPEYLEQSKINLTDQIDLRKKQNCIKDANNMTEQHY